MHDPRYAVLRALLVDQRERNGLTQVEIATRLGKPQSYVSKYERGERRIDLVEYVDVTRAIGIDPVSTLQELIEKIG